MNVRNADSSTPRASDGAGAGLAVWYFLGATFLFAAAGWGFTAQSYVLGGILFALGFVLVAAGGWMFSKEITARRDAAAAGNEEQPPAPRI